MSRTKAVVFALTLAIAAIVGVSYLTPLLRGEEARGRTSSVGTAPTEAYTTYNWQHVRMDEMELSKLGGGSVEEGLNALGDEGYELFIVTSVIESGGAGYHFFKRPPWDKPFPRLKLGYKRADTKEITELGGASYKDGLTKMEKEWWELVAVTVKKDGGVGYHYFMRPKR